MTTGAIAAVIAASDRRIANQLREAGAVSAERAVPLEAQRGIDKRRLERLIESGVVHQASPGIYWLDEAAWTAFSSTRRSRVLVALALAILVAVAITYLYRGH